MAKAAKVPVTKGKASTPQPAFWDPWLSLRDEINDVFERFAPGAYLDSFWRRHPDIDALDWAPALGMRPQVDLTETDKAYELSAELPGIDEKDVELVMQQGVLTIKGEKREHKDDENKGFRVSERRYGKFQRSFAVPPNVDTNKVTAKFANGVLSITLPKTKKARSQRKIPIKAS